MVRSHAPPQERATHPAIATTCLPTHEDVRRAFFCWSGATSVGPRRFRGEPTSKRPGSHSKEHGGIAHPRVMA